MDQGLASSPNLNAREIAVQQKHPALLNRGAANSPSCNFCVAAVFFAQDPGERYEYKSGSLEWHSDGRLAASGGPLNLFDFVLHLCNDNDIGFTSGVRRLNMRKFLLTAILSVAVLPVIASAHGCIKGAAVGAVVGHVAGHHAVAGAAVGCAVGHHRAKEKEKQATQPQPISPAPTTPHAQSGVPLDNQ